MRLVDLGEVTCLVANPGTIVFQTGARFSPWVLVELHPRLDPQVVRIVMEFLIRVAAGRWIFFVCGIHALT